jgi:hypothetical protein
MTKDPEKERESVRWLSLAAEQGDSRARFNLGLQQLHGIGTPIDVASSVVNCMMASFAGFEDARKFFDLVRPVVPHESWQRIFDRVEWPDLTILMGPLTKGHLDGIRQSQENDQGNDDAVWLKYEREFAKTMFPSTAHTGSILDAAFGESVIVERVFVGRAFVENSPVAGITISLRNITLRNGFPVYWKPSEDGLKAVAARIGLVGGRDWVRYLYSYK